MAIFVYEVLYFKEQLLRMYPIQFTRLPRRYSIRKAPRNDAIPIVTSTGKYYIYTMKNCYVYFMTNRRNTVIYIGVTSDLKKRVNQHRAKQHKGFTFRYNCDKLVYFEQFSNITEAINREKQLKKRSRLKKECLIERLNPKWEDLYEGL